MRYLLATLAAASVAGCVGTPTTPVASQYTVAQSSGGSNCLRVAQPGDTKIQIYCTKVQRQSNLDRVWPLPAGRRSGSTSSDTGCRWLANATGKGVEKTCRTTAQWTEFDTQAVSAGLTCRWLRGVVTRAPAELCLTAAQWQIADANIRRGRPAYASTGSGWPSGAPTPMTSGLDSSSSYGYFPAGTAIGATR